LTSSPSRKSLAISSQACLSSKEDLWRLEGNTASKTPESEQLEAHKGKLKDHLTHTNASLDQEAYSLQKCNV
jgi:hypothetical protein